MKHAALFALLRTGAFVLGFGLVAVAALMLADRPGTIRDVEPTAEAVVVTTAQADRVADLIEEHDCWTDEAPPDVEVPGHVVVVDEAGKVIYGGPKYVDQALRQVFEGADYGLTVAAFCR